MNFYSSTALSVLILFLCYVCGVIAGSRPERKHYHFTIDTVVEVVFPLCGQLYERIISAKVTKGAYDFCYVFRMIFFLSTPS